MPKHKENVPLNPEQAARAAAHVGLALSMYRRLPGVTAVNDPDARHEALWAVVQAAQCWHEGRGIPFSLYLWSRVRGAVGNVRTEWRRRPRPAPLDGRPDIPAPAPDDAPPHDDILRLDAAMVGLSDRQRRLLDLTFRQGLSVRAAARELGVSQPAARAMQGRAFDAIRRHFARASGGGLDTGQRAVS
jgi:RNA polymerase sigma factor (sigma-70 family)